MNLNTAAIWERLCADTDFQRFVPEGPTRDVVRQFIDELAISLWRIFDQPLTLESFFLISLRIGEHMLQTDFVDRFVASLPEDASARHPGILATQARGRVEEDLELHRQGLKRIPHLPPEAEERAFAHMPPDIKSLYEQRRWRIGEVFEQCPIFFLLSYLPTYRQEQSPDTHS